MLRFGLKTRLLFNVQIGGFFSFTLAMEYEIMLVPAGPLIQDIKRVLKKILGEKGDETKHSIEFEQLGLLKPAFETRNKKQPSDLRPARTISFVPSSQTPVPGSGCDPYDEKKEQNGTAKGTQQHKRNKTRKGDGKKEEKKGNALRYAMLMYDLCPCYVTMPALLCSLKRRKQLKTFFSQEKTARADRPPLFNARGGLIRDPVHSSPRPSRCRRAACP